jgi:GxxExxY protein
MGANDETTGAGTKLLYEELTRQIIGAAIEVHRVLGPGLLESVYERALCHELTLRNLSFKRQIAMSLHYKGIELEGGFRLDIVVAEKVIVELKSIAQILPVHEAQLLTYMRITNKPVGLIINFNVPVLKHGIVRRVL